MTLPRYLPMRDAGLPLAGVIVVAILMALWEWWR